MANQIIFGFQMLWLAGVLYLLVFAIIGWVGMVAARKGQTVHDLNLGRCSDLPCRLSGHLTLYDSLEILFALGLDCKSRLVYNS